MALRRERCWDSTGHRRTASDGVSERTCGATRYQVHRGLPRCVPSDNVRSNARRGRFARVNDV